MSSTTKLSTSDHGLTRENLSTKSSKAQASSSSPSPSPTPSEYDYNNSLMATIEKKQIPVSRNILLVLYLTNYTCNVPAVVEITSKFLHLQNKTQTLNGGTSVYDMCFDDIYIVIHGLVFFTFLRSFLMQYVFAPFAAYMFQIGKSAKVRFAEQSWTFTYATSSFLYGMYLYYNSSYWGNLDNVFKGWPHNQMSGAFKLYYLLQLSFWFQQIFVLNIEKKRKDHYQMFGHHIITCLLVVGSYKHYYTRIGNLILIIMDSGDIFLTAAKILKYAGFTTLCDVMFVCFLVSWVVLRHGVYNYLFYHAVTKSHILMEGNMCIPGVETGELCWSSTVLTIFFWLLGLLQIICCIWLYSILRVAYKVITGSGAEDVRSDSEDTDDELLDEFEDLEQELVKEVDSEETEVEEEKESNVDIK